MVMWFKHSDLVSTDWTYSLLASHYIMFTTGTVLLITYHMKTRSRGRMDGYAVGIQLNEC